jgi:hypothetical protein
MKRRQRTNKPEAADTSNIATEVATQAPLAILGGLLTLPDGGATALEVASFWDAITPSSYLRL